jgi:hypothetical protein
LEKIEQPMVTTTRSQAIAEAAASPIHEGIEAAATGCEYQEDEDCEVMVVECIYPVMAEDPNSPDEWDDEWSEFMRFCLGATKIEYVGVTVHHRNTMRDVHAYEFIATGTMAMCFKRLQAHTLGVDIKWKDDFYANL